jgi:hypothetical protein
MVLANGGGRPQELEGGWRDVVVLETEVNGAVRVVVRGRDV